MAEIVPSINNPASLLSVSHSLSPFLTADDGRDRVGHTLFIAQAQKSGLRPSSTGDQEAEKSVVFFGANGFSISVSLGTRITVTENVLLEQLILTGRIDNSRCRQHLTSHVVWESSSDRNHFVSAFSTNSANSSEANSTTVCQIILPALKTRIFQGKLGQFCQRDGISASYSTDSRNPGFDRCQ